MFNFQACPSARILGQLSRMHAYRGNYNHSIQAEEYHQPANYPAQTYEPEFGAGDQPYAQQDIFVQNVPSATEQEVPEHIQNQQVQASHWEGIQDLSALSQAEQIDNAVDSVINGSMDSPDLSPGPMDSGGLQAEPLADMLDDTMEPEPLEKRLEGPGMSPMMPLGGMPFPLGG